MPLYAFNCDGCSHTFDEGMSVATFKAKKEDEHGGFRFKTCTRCKRKGRVVHDALRQYKSQSPPQMDKFVFYENAPDEILRGERTRETTRAEAARLLDEHGLVQAGNSAKIKRRSATVIDKGKIAEKWAERYGDTALGPAAPIQKSSDVAVSKDGKPVNPLANGAVVVLEEPEDEKPWDKVDPFTGVPYTAAAAKRDNLPKVVDIMRDPSLTITAKWNVLKRTAKRLEIRPPRTTTRPELERLIQDAVRARKQSAAK